MAKSITANKGSVATGKGVKVPLITWGGDVATIYANGNRTSQQGSIFAQKGLSIELFREDNFVRAVEKVITGETPYLRGTMGMVNSAVEVLKARGIEMVVIYQMTWSEGGDTIVVRSDVVQTPADLKGRYIGLQLYGPHMDYLKKVLEDSGLSLGDIKVRWLRELTIPPYDTKGTAVDPVTAMQRDPSLAAVMVISPDMAALTSGGTVGTGAESSVKDAKLLLSTKTAGRVIADVYAVRKDYLDAHRSEAEAFTSGLLIAQEEMLDLLQNRSQRQTEYQNILRTSAEILRDSPQATGDIEGLLGDATFVKYAGNVQFFTGQGTVRTFEALTKEAQEALISFGLMSAPVPVAQANWDYGKLAQGLRDTAGVVVPRFDPAKVEQAVKARQVQTSTREGELFQFEILFQPRQATFSVELYQQEFSRVINLASTYPGAIVIVEGHSDPTQYLQVRDRVRKGELPEIVLEDTRKAAKNLSLQRALSVRDSILAFAKQRQLSLDPSQFTVVGAGIDKPKYSNPATEVEWRQNMRVVFQFIQVEAEMEKFSPAGR
jgi:ABC-type nitrate/sulfonate/bicarbonate transport system substrate-binding protein/outer membrane protein OmpA-like peptidoglycan-associated protein